MSGNGRRKRKGGLLPRGKFLPIPVEVAKKACAVLSGPELRTFVAICAQSQHWNNGTAMLCRSVCREWNLGSSTTVTSARAKMLEHGLIVQTRIGAQHRAAMYGVTYLSLSEEAMAKAGASATKVVTLNGHSAIQTGVALQSYRGCNATATDVVTLEPSGASSATDAVACGPEKSRPALQTVYPSKNLPCGKGHRSRKKGSQP